MIAGPDDAADLARPEANESTFQGSAMASITIRSNCLGAPDAQKEGKMQHEKSGFIGFKQKKAIHLELAPSGVENAIARRKRCKLSELRRWMSIPVVEVNAPRQVALRNPVDHNGSLRSDQPEKLCQKRL
jgi:hypothetical protein